MEPLTDQEKQVLTKELAERLKDIVFMEAEQQAADIVERLEQDLLGYGIDTLKGEGISFSFMVHMGGRDVVQIIGRERRRQAEEAKP